MANCVNDSNSEIAAFVSAIEGSKFVVHDVNEELIVVDDTSLTEGFYGKYIEIELKELSKPLDQLLKVLNNERKAAPLEGVSRIVGYYSRTSNWNKSKIGELRDRGQGNYKLASVKSL